MTYEVEIEGRTHQIAVERSDRGWTVSIDGGAPRTLEGSAVGRSEWLLREAGRGRSVGCWVEGEHAYLQVAGHALRATVVDPRTKALAEAVGGPEGTVVTPMPGVVNRIVVSQGQAVTKGQVLLVVEAMKMENEYRSPCDGTVATIHVEAGKPVEANAKLITVEPA